MDQVLSAFSYVRSEQKQFLHYKESLNAYHLGFMLWVFTKE